MSSSDPISCNRQPFLSDKDCDRGSVDIHQFDDLPFCESFSPTLPEIPPEIVDTPINLPVPPVCACFNIDYALNLKYNKDRKFAASASFSAKGDCCEGNYVSNLNLQIPCPILGSGTSKKIKMKIGYGNGKQSASVSYLRADKDSCAIEAKNVNIDLNIHCPVISPRNRKIKIGISYGKDFNSISASFIKANSDSCTVEPLNPEFRLNIPCPIIRRDKKNPKIKAKVGWGSQAKSVSASYMAANTEDCTIEPYDVNLELEVPCPVKKNREGNKVKFGIKWGSKSYVSASIFKVASSSCMIEANPATFNLEVKCPIIHSEQHKRSGGICYPKFRRRWVNPGSWTRTYKSYDGNFDFIKIDERSCTIEVGKFDLDIPCPIKHSDQHKKVGNICYPKFRRRWVNAGSWTRTYKSYAGNFDFIKINESSCTIEVGKLDLDIPCPVKHSDQHKKVGSICYPKFRRRWVNPGSWTRTYKSYDGNFDFIKINESSCTIEVGKLDLDIPCPIKHSSWHIKKSDGYCYAKWRRRWTWGTNNKGRYSSFSTSFIKINESSCTIEVGKFDLDIPCPVSRQKLIIQASTSYNSRQPARIWIESSSFSGSACYRRIKIRARFGVDCSKSVIQDIRYNTSRHALQIKTYNMKTKVLSAWKDVFTAVGHKSDHACCNDV